MPLTTFTKPTWFYSPTDDIFRADSPCEPHGIPILPRIVKPEPESPIMKPRESPITPAVKEEGNEKPCHLILRLPKQAARHTDEEDKKLAALMLPPSTQPSSSKTKMGTRASKHKILLKLRLTPLKTPMNKSRHSRGQDARNHVRAVDFLEYQNLGITPLMGKYGGRVFGEEYLGLSGVDVGDEEKGEGGERRVGMGLYDNAGCAGMSLGEMKLRQRLWGLGRWANRETKV